MVRKDRFAKIEVTEIEVVPMNCTTPAPIVMIGNSFYFRIDPKIIRYYDLMNRDMLKVCIIEAQRVKSERRMEEVK